MWIETLDNGKFKYIERFTDPYTEKYKKVSVTLNSDSRRAWNEAQRILNSKIDTKLKTKKDITKKTFEEVSFEWIEEYKHHVKGRTYASRVYSLNKLLREYLTKEKKYIISNMTNQTLQDILDDLRYDKKLSYNYVRNINDILRMVFRYAHEHKYVDNLDAILYSKVTKPIKTIEQLESEANPKYLEKNELENVLATLRRYNEDLADLFEFQAYTGMRISEVVALEEKDIIGNIVHVRGTFDPVSTSPTHGQKTAPKTNGSFRKIEISDRLVEILNIRIEKNKYLTSNYLNERYKDTSYIFVSSKKRPYDTSYLRSVLRKYQDEFKTDTLVRSHIFRHTHISMLAEAGVPLYVIKDRVGHSGGTITENIYLHVTKKRKEELYNVLEDL